MSIFNTPIQINKLTIHNRLVMPPMESRCSSDDGELSPRIYKLYDTRSKGGYIGLVITEHNYISQEGKGGKGQPSIATDRSIEILSKLVSNIHENGSKVFAQIGHAGAKTTPDVTGMDIMGPSALKIPIAAPDAPVPKEMTISDIQKVIADFTAAALRAKAAGYDGVELHGAHGYLLNQFYSPLSNKRTDAYNGSTIDGRIRLHLEIIQAIRSAVGPDYPLAIRLGACDYMEGGITIEDSVIAAKEFEQAGVDLLDISGGYCIAVHPTSKEQGYFAELSEPIRKAVSIPVMLTGGIVTPQAAEQLLEEGKADLTGVGRAILKDRAWPQKAVEALA